MTLQSQMLAHAASAPNPKALEPMQITLFGGREIVPIATTQMSQTEDEFAELVLRVWPFGRPTEACRGSAGRRWLANLDGEHSWRAAVQLGLAEFLAR